MELTFRERHQIEVKIVHINLRLDCGKLREKGGYLSFYSGRFPPKDESDVAGYCNRHELSLGMKAASLLDSEKHEAVLAWCKEIDLALFKREWQWPRISAPQERVGDAVAGFESQWFSKHGRSPHKQQQWRDEFAHRFNWLKPKVRLTTDHLLRVLNQRTEANSKSRLATSIIYGQLADYAGLDGEVIRTAGKGWTRKLLQPRDLPTVEEVMAVYESLAQWPEYQSGFVLFILYGIRNHELLYCQQLDEVVNGMPLIHISEGKTGSRDAFGLRRAGMPELVWDGRVPSINMQRRDGTARSHKEIGAAVARAYACRGVARLYTYRHWFAATGFQRNVPPDKMALSMGHSLSVHIQTYRAWINRATFAQALGDKH